MFVDYPCYMHNYLIAGIIGWQVHDTLKQKFGEGYAFNNNVGQFLIDNLYKNGMLNDWRGILKGATGKTLDVDGYLKYLGM
jgi:Zn-dependent M32 family carboxypeptidase